MVFCFDFDGTLIKDDTIKLFIEFFSSRRIIWIRIFIKLTIFLFRKGIISNYRFKFLIFRIVRAELSEIDMFIDYLLNYLEKNQKLNNYLLDLIRVEIDKKNTVIILTASPDFIVLKILEKIIPTHFKSVIVIGSKLIYKNDRIVGLKLNCYRQNKVKALKGLGIKEIDIFYTDSIEDDKYVSSISKKTILVGV